MGIKASLPVISGISIQPEIQYEQIDFNHTVYQNGDVVFEETLKQQESYLVDKEIFRGELRAGNAQNVFFVIDEKVFGPLSRNKSVVKNISLNPELIKLNFRFSTTATESYAIKNFDQIIVDTAGVTE